VDEARYEVRCRLERGVPRDEGSVTSSPACALLVHATTWLGNNPRDVLHECTSSRGLTRNTYSTYHNILVIIISSSTLDP